LRYNCLRELIIHSNTNSLNNLDILGNALLDYHFGRYTEDIITETNISDADELPLPYLFRSYAEMPKLEQNALKHCRGTILDVGCGAGSHALYLQEKGLNVTAIDTSEGAVEVAKLRGLHQVSNKALLDYKNERYDTILLLMNGTGIFERVSGVPEYLQHLKTLLNENGQILIDSSDLQYTYPENEDGSIWVPANHYYGELQFTMSYKEEKTGEFPWLYLGESLFEELATSNGFKFEILKRGENFDYLARLTVAAHNPL